MRDRTEWLVDQARQAFENGQIEISREIATQRKTKSVHDADYHVRWADMLDELGMPNEAIRELNYAIRDNPDRLDVYPRLAEVLMDENQPHRSAKVWKALVAREPSCPGHYKGWGLALREAGELEQARAVYEDALIQTGDASFKGLLKDFGPASNEERQPPPPTSPNQVVPERHHLVTFASLFESREGVYARQWVSPTGETGYTPVEEPLTMKVAENHLIGNITVGVYPVRLDNSVNFIAFDVDIAQHAIRRAITNKKDWETLVQKVHKVACNVVDIGAAHEIPVYLEDSGFKGRHCWIFLEQPIPAGLALQFGASLSQQLTTTPPETNLEIFPKQAWVRRGGLGNLIKLPLGIHRRTGKRALFLKPQGEPYADQMQFLEGIQRCPKSAILAFLQRYQDKPRNGTHTDNKQPPQRPPRREFSPRREQRSVDVFDLNKEAPFQYLISQCLTLNTLVELIHRSAELSSDETRVLIHTIGHLRHGPQIVNELLRRCINADPIMFMNSRLNGNPMSCPKISVPRFPDLPHL